MESDVDQNSGTVEHSSTEGNISKSNQNHLNAHGAQVTRAGVCENQDQVDISWTDPLKPLRFRDVFDMLEANYAWLTGGRSILGSPIITLPNCCWTAATADEHSRTLRYLISLLPSSEVETLRVVVVVDRRESDWSTVWTILDRIFEYESRSIGHVYVLRPNTSRIRQFFESHFGERSPMYTKAGYKDRVSLLASHIDLYRNIDRADLTPDVGGTLTYDHNDWLIQSERVDQLTETCREMMIIINDTRDAMQQTVADASSLYASSAETRFDQISARYSEAVTRVEDTVEQANELATSVRESKLITGSIDQASASASSPHPTCQSSPNCHPTAYKNLHIIAIQRLIVTLQAEEKNLKTQWSSFKLTITDIIERKRLEERLLSLSPAIASNLGQLGSFMEVGDSLVEAIWQLEELQQFEAKTKADFENAEELLRDWSTLVSTSLRSSNGNCSVTTEDQVVTKPTDSEFSGWEELQRNCVEYRELVSARYQLLRTSVELHSIISNANQWCTSGEDLLARIAVSDCKTESLIQSALGELISFIDSYNESPHSQISSKEFRKNFDSVITPATSVTVQSTTEQLEWIKASCAEREKQLNTALADMTASHASSTASAKAQSLQRLRITPPRPSVTFDYSLSSPPIETGTIRRKRGNVIQELIETERVYTKELKSVLDGYVEQWQNPELRQLLPTKLIDKRHVLFGNMDKIYEFHSQVFVNALEDCGNSPALVGPCFVKHKEQFKLYGAYCLNKLAADRLIQDVGQDNQFFVECQRLLGHRLPLSAYLLKPVQRITKYHLLLKELLKVSSTMSAHNDSLRDAVSTMCDLLKYVNNVMHQQSIVNYPGDFTELGLLLMQGPVELYVGRRKDKVVPEVRLKTTHRHVFLYERAIVFCKRRDESNSDREVYTYKNSLLTDQIGLTQSPKGADERKFELWCQGRNDVYILIAPTVASKREWIADIERVLFNQFEHIKESNKKNKTLPDVLTRSSDVNPTHSLPPIISDRISLYIDNNNVGSSSNA